MKVIITSVALASLFSLAACNRSELKEKNAALEAQQHTIDSMNDELAKQKIIDSMTDATSMQYVLPPAAIPAPVVYSTRKANSSRYSGRKASSTSTNTSSTSNNTVAQAPVAEQPAAKKGWSAKAKGAVIGAGTGAAAGAIINKRNRAAGAVIGGILGAGAGTGVGAVIDKKNDR